MNEMISIAAFLKRKLPKISISHQRRSRENLLMWLSWHTARYNACAIKKEGKIVAVGVARAIYHVIDANMPYVNNELGKICYVEQVVSSHKEGMKDLLRYVQQRWKNCDRIMFKREKSANKYKIYDMSDFMKKAGVLEGMGI